MTIIKNLTWHLSYLKKADRQRLKNHKSAILWFTGLSGAGKSTLSAEVEKRLHDKGIHTYILDGDNIRHGLNNNLGFSMEDRKENIRRIGEVAKLFVDAGLFVLTAFISPYRDDRKTIRNQVDENEFIEIYVKCDIDTCEKRDPKGLYEKARKGEIKNFTGIDDPYEEPENADIVVETDKMDLKQSVDLIISYLQEREII